MVAIRDTPTMPFNVPECLSKGHECTVKRAAVFSDEDPIVLAAREEPSVALLDFSDAICSADSCAPIIGKVLVWRDNEHLTATYASSLGELSARRLTRFRGVRPSFSGKSRHDTCASVHQQYHQETLTNFVIALPPIGPIAACLDKLGDMAPIHASL